MDTYLKQPKDILDYDIDASNWFSSIPGDDIESVTITVTSVSEEVPTLVLGPNGHPEYVLLGVSPVRFKIWVGGGTDYAEYKISCLIKTEQDREIEHDIKIKVRDR